MCTASSQQPVIPTGHMRSLAHPLGGAKKLPTEQRIFPSSPRQKLRHNLQRPHKAHIKKEFRHNSCTMSKFEGEKLTPVYVEDKDSSWAVALQLHRPGNANKATIVRPIFKTENQMMQCGKVGKIKFGPEETVDLTKYPNKCLPMQNVDSEGNLDDYKDMVELPFMHEVSAESCPLCSRSTYIFVTVSYA